LTRYFTYRSLDDLVRDAEQQAAGVGFEEDIGPLLQPVEIGRLTAGNRMAVHPMEGCDGTLDGRPGELTFKRWQAFGAGGGKIIWGEATAVVPEGRANPRQLLLNSGTAGAFEDLLTRARRAHRDRFGVDRDLVVGLQLTHSGRWSRPRALIARHHPAIDRVRGADAEPVSDDYLEELEDRYVECAGLAAAAGFDFVDIKQCHTYLLNELLAARNRTGAYGGSIENRTRFVTSVVRKIRDRVGGRLVLATRINVFDGPPFSSGEHGTGVPSPDGEGGFGVQSADLVSPDMSEPLEVIRRLREAGVQMVNVTMGSPYFNPHIGRPFERQPVDGYTPPEHPLAGVDRHFRLTAEVQRAFPGLVVIGTGYSWLRHYAANAGAANVRRGRVSVMGLGRGALAYPDFAADLMEHGRMIDRKSCIGVSYCTALMRAKNNELGQFPTGCAPRDPFYAEQYRLSRRGGDQGSRTPPTR
jgi:2,4-dienoyl-CoA reductase-like NADH-dependent reductase (Old Yellow Enzyme family)